MASPSGSIEPQVLINSLLLIFSSGYLKFDLHLICFYLLIMYLGVAIIGSGFKSVKPFRSGYFGASIKLQAGYTAGVITSLYVRARNSLS